jgi:hypothetical protein
MSNNCAYKFRQGKKEGHICDKPCRGDFCKDHNDNRKKYQKTYQKGKSIINKKEKENNLLDEIAKATDTTKFNLAKRTISMNLLEADNLDLYRKKYGCRKVLGFEEEDEEMIEKLDKLVNPEGKFKRNTIIDFYGTKDQAIKKLKKIDKEFESNKIKYKKDIKIMNAIRRRNKELKELNN